MGVLLQPQEPIWPLNLPTKKLLSTDTPVQSGAPPNREQGQVPQDLD
jgi:hypothetical protein